MFVFLSFDAAARSHLAEIEISQSCGCSIRVGEAGESIRRRPKRGGGLAGAGEWAKNPRPHLW
jgi:hypothetical protein